MLQEIIKERKEKLKKLRDNGFNPYPASVKRTHTLSEVLDGFKTLESSKKQVSVVGRVRGKRGQGNISFLDLEDASGRMQIVFKSDITKDFKKIVPNIDVGDFLEVGGKAFTTQKGEKSIEGKNVRVINKTLLPLPDSHYGIEDIEVKLRKRYLDLILNSETKELFIKKSKFWQSIRNFLLEDGFLEVETPVLEATPGGAEAEPFKTHHNALDEEFYLRISLEIALKKLMVGGFEKVFEIGRIFRNEGISNEHLQDYTVLEFYSAYEDYNDLMKFVEKMYKYVIKETFGTLTFEHKGKKVNWGGKWKKIDYFEVFKKGTKLDLEKATYDDLFKKAKELKLPVTKKLSKGRLIDLLFKKTVRPTLIEPSFLVDTPVDIEPLAKRHRDNDKKVERFQVVAYGSELGKGFSEGNDPLDQRERFMEQEKARKEGDKEAQMLDEDFLEALEVGMPPTAGFGLSERLFAVLAGRPIRETVFFPLMKKK